MNKERLEEIKNSYLVGIHSLFGTPYISMPKENFDWLIKQAERVEELEEEIKNLEERCLELGAKLEVQNRFAFVQEKISVERLNEQIERIWELDKINQMYMRKSERYREALKNILEQIVSEIEKSIGE